MSWLSESKAIRAALRVSTTASSSCATTLRACDGCLTLSGQCFEALQLMAAQCQLLFGLGAEILLAQHFEISLCHLQRKAFAQSGKVGRGSPKVERSLLALCRDASTREERHGDAGAQSGGVGVAVHIHVLRRQCAAEVEVLAHAGIGGGKPGIAGRVERNFLRTDGGFLQLHVYVASSGVFDALAQRHRSLCPKRTGGGEQNEQAYQCFVHGEK